MVDGGDLGWKSSHLADAAASQQRDKLDLQLAAFAMAGIDGWTPGEGDLALGLDAVRDTAARHGVPVVAANLRCDGKAPFPAARVAERGGVRLGLVGLIDPDLLGSGVGGCVAEPPGPALAAALAEIGPVDAVVVLSHMDGEDDAGLVPSLPDGALVVNGHARLSHSDAVSLGGGAVQLGAGSRGKALGLAEITFAEGGRGFAGGESSGVERRMERYAARLEKARATLEGAGTDEKARSRAQHQVEFYERELAEMQAQVAATAADSGQARHAIAVKLVQLGQDIAEHPATLALVDQAKERLDAATVDAGLPEGPPVGEPSFAGSRACQACHEAEHSQWSTTPHAGAWTSLVGDKRQLDDACWRCHATGAFDPGGPQHPLQVGPPLQGVGCESCHGPGKAHVAQPVAGNILLDPSPAVCTRCHDGEQDEGRFDWATYRPKVLHAAPVAEGG